MASAMHYEKSGKYIRDVAVDESRIHLELVSDRDGGFFGEAEEETLVCNAKVLPGKMDDIGWYASDVRGRGLFCAAGPGYFRFPEDPDHFPEKNGAGGE